MELKNMFLQTDETSEKLIELINQIMEIPDETESRGYSKATKAVLSHKKINSLGWKARYNMAEGIKTTLHQLKNME